MEEEMKAGRPANIMRTFVNEKEERNTRVVRKISGIN